MPADDTPNKHWQAGMPGIGCVKVIHVHVTGMPVS